MTKTFVTSDTHFGHWGVCKFLRTDGTKLRPWEHPDDMDKVLVENWNAVVGPNDKVYHLGDVVMNRRCLKTMALLNGDKILVKGNHDIFKLEDYTPYFRDIRAYVVLNNIIFSHIPLHPQCKGRFKGNVHGHLHANLIDDPFYLNVSVEQTEYRPVNLESIFKHYNPQHGKENKNGS